MNWKLKVKIVEKFGTQWRFAQHVGVDDSLVSKAITGATRLQPEQKEKWAKALKAPVEELFA